MQFPPRLDNEQIRQRLNRIRGPVDRPPEATIVIPVNAQGDLDNVLRTVSDLARYEGGRRWGLTLVVNNYSPDSPPTEVEMYRQMGIHALTIPNVRRPGGEAVCLSARLPGVREAPTDACLLFDADVRIQDPTELIDWYIDQFREGAKVAYTYVGYFDLPRGLSLKLRFLVHHGSRWFKRAVLGIPVTRGSSYGVSREVMLQEHAKGTLADDLNIGPAFKAAGHRVAYGRRRGLRVFTSGRMFRPGWLRMVPYFWYRFKYNLRTLPVGPDAVSRTGRENDAPDRYVYVDNKPAS